MILIEFGLYLNMCVW